MARTNIELDEALIAAAMKRFGLKTKREVVDLALRRLVGPPLTPEFLAGLRGLGWDGDLDALRSGSPAATADVSEPADRPEFTR